MRRYGASFAGSPEELEGFTDGSLERSNRLRRVYTWQAVGAQVSAPRGKASRGPPWPLGQRHQIRITRSSTGGNYKEGREEDVEGDVDKLKSGDPEESQREEISEDSVSNIPGHDKA